MLLQDYNVAIFKEPRGIIKLLELVFAIVAMAVLVSFKSTGGISVTTSPSDGGISYYAKFTVSYDFDDDDYNFIDRTGQVVGVGADTYGGSAQFYIASSCLTLVYVLAFTVSYVFVEPRLNPGKADIFHLFNFVGTCLLTIFWLSTGAVWAKATDGVPLVVDNGFTKFFGTTCISGTRCTEEKPGYGGMIVAVILAFLNFFIWAFDCWFVFKETKIFRSRFQKYEVSGAVKFKHRKPDEEQQQQGAGESDVTPSTEAAPAPEQN